MPASRMATPSPKRITSVLNATSKSDFCNKIGPISGVRVCTAGCTKIFVAANNGSLQISNTLRKKARPSERDMQIGFWAPRVGVKQNLRRFKNRLTGGMWPCEAFY
jgi:hypothetical protein